MSRSRFSHSPTSLLLKSGQGPFPVVCSFRNCSYPSLCLFPLYVGPVVELPPGPSCYLVRLFYIGPVVELPPRSIMLSCASLLCWTCGGTSPRAIVFSFVCLLCRTCGGTAPRAIMFSFVCRFMLDLWWNCPQVHGCNSCKSLCYSLSCYPLVHPTFKQ